VAVANFLLVSPLIVLKSAISMHAYDGGLRVERAYKFIDTGTDILHMLLLVKQEQ